MVVSPQIRQQLSNILRQHIDDLAVLGFTELPDNRKINVVATISGADDAKLEEK
jgi:flagellar biosynthesis protein FlhA